ARLLTSSLEKEELDSIIFDIIRHYTHALPLLKDEEERIRVIELSLTAFQKAKDSAAHQAALEIIKTAESLLPDNHWELHYNLAKALYIAMHEAWFFNHDFDRSDQIFEVLSRKLQTTLEKVPSYLIKIQQDTMKGLYKQAIDVSFDILGQLGLSITEEHILEDCQKELSLSNPLLKNLDYESLLNQPIIDDPTRNAIAQVIGGVAPTSFFYNPLINCYLALYGIRLLCEAGGLEYIGYPLSLGTLAYIPLENDYSKGHDLALLGVRLAERNKDKRGQYSATHVYALFTVHWKRPYQEGVIYGRKAFQGLLESGDIQMAGYTFFETICALYEQGQPLVIVQSEIDQALHFITKTKNQHALGSYVVYRQLLRSLRGKTASVKSFDDEEFNEETHLSNIGQNIMALDYYHIYKAVLLYLFGDFKKAFDHLTRSEPLLAYITGFAPVSTHNFFYSLTLCQLAWQSSEEEQKVYFGKLEKNQQQLQRWADGCPENFQHRFMLVKAEIEAVKGNILAAQNSYEESIRLANVHEHLNEEALAYECAACSYHKWGMEKFSRLYFFEAATRYSEWGATAKVSQLMKEHALYSHNNRLGSRASDPTVFSTINDGSIDALSIIKSSQVISHQINLEDLLKNLLQVLLENAGAESGYLLIARDGQLLVEARTIKSGSIRVLESIPLDNAETSKFFPVSIIQYVSRTLKPLILEDSYLKKQYSTDPYMQQYQPRSLLCLPLTYQNKLSGIIYLENRTVTGAFTPAHLEMLNLLASQASISIENASLYANLEKTVLERTLQLQEKTEELEVKKQQADMATIAKSEFLANMSHEIRIPMNAVVGLSYLLMQTELTPKQYSYLHKIDLSAKNLLGIINDILDFSKIEANKLTLEDIEFNLEEVLNNLSTLVLAKAETKEELEIAFDISPNVPKRLIGDPLRFGQILINLTGNAIKFTEKGTVIVKMEVEKQALNIIGLKVSVKDTGIGMTEEQKARLFQSFTQADMSTSRKFGGTGLGLAISKQLVEMMGGEIWVDSIYGKGTEFTFKIPFTIIPCEVIGEKSIPEMNLKGLKVLTVDDSPIVLKIIERELQSLSFKVVTADSGKNAIKLIEEADKNEPYQLVFMDFLMPGMNGIETIKLIQKSDTITHKPKFIMLTAHTREDIMSSISQIHLDGFLLKPVTTSALFNAIIECFNDQKASVAKQIKQKKFSKEGLKIIRGARVLLVEDNVINQEVATEILMHMSLNVTLAKDGYEAIDKANNESFDIVLMDIQMPRLDGIEATIRIRKNKDKHELPIVAMTANAMMGDIEKSLRSGMNDHITKPIDPDVLFRTLVKWIKPMNRAYFEPAQAPSQDKPKQVFNFEALRDIDTKVGLSRLGENENFYGNILMRFYKENKDSLDNIKTALAAKDIDTARRVAHTLKGTSGNIGAVGLQEASMELEEALKSNDSTKTNDLLVSFEMELNRVLDSLKDFVPINNPSNQNSPLIDGNSEELKSLLVELDLFVENSKPKQCGQILSKIALTKWTEEATKKLLEIKEVIGSYDFEMAGMLLKSLMKDLNEKHI
ncbi:MAG: response regulator, partial [Lentisphaerota bacterium]